MPSRFLAQINIGEEYKFGDEGVSSVFTTLGDFISATLPNVYIIAGLILFFFLLFGGFMFMLKSSEENPEGMLAGKKAITAAVAGFTLIFLSYWIMQIIQVITGINFFNPPLD
jgi:hypothetical protein